MSDRPVLLVSNRGPISFRRDASGDLVAARGAGGLVSGLSPLFAGTEREWLAAALSDDDREAVAELSGTDHLGHCEVSVDGVRAILVAVDATDLTASYEQVCNETLWFVHHHLFDLARTPAFDAEWFDAWEAYRRVNVAFANAVAEVAPPDAVVLVQDYHLCLLGPLVAARRDDLATVHFSHTPFAAAEMLRVLPESVRVELLEGMAGHGACGFHTDRWRRLFVECCEADGVTPPDTFVAPLGPDVEDLAATASSEACAVARRGLDRDVGDRRVIARVDRIELSKNLLRGFAAFDVMLETHAEWRDRVVFVASVYPSREGSDVYIRYHRDVIDLVDSINERWATPAWQPILLFTSDDYPRSIATLTMADVVLVNSVRDGLNLVAKESMLVNDQHALLALSAETGAWEELSDVATEVHAFDIAQTAETLHELLAAPQAERRQRSAALRERSAQRSPADWLADQLRAAHSR